jgi:hypothetical protein
MILPTLLPATATPRAVARFFVKCVAVALIDGKNLKMDAELGRFCGPCLRISQKPESNTKDDPLGQDELVVFRSQRSHHERKCQDDGSRSEQQSWPICVEEPTDKTSL